MALNLAYHQESHAPVTRFLNIWQVPSYKSSPELVVYLT